MKIIIAGSSSGIGRAIAEKLLSEKHNVIGLARQHQKFSPENNNYSTYTIDFSKVDALEKQFKQIQSEHSPIDAIICSVGYGEFNELEQFSVEKMQRMMNVNFLSQAILIKSFLPSLKTQKSGKIILIGSECALEGQKKGSMYCASKFALRGFAQSLRKECSTANVTVTLINPGMVATSFFDELTFRPAAGEPHAILPEQIAAMISLVLKENTNCVYEEINLQPLKKVLEKKFLID